jgi:hypothetical protein
MNRNETRPSPRPRVADPGHYALRPGTRVQVKHCAQSYPLPSGLEPEEWVTIQGFDAGYYMVEKAGREFRVFMTNIVGGPLRQHMNLIASPGQL